MPDEGEWINQVCARIHRCTHAHVRTCLRVHIHARTHSGVLPNLKKGALTQAVTRTSLEDVSEEA